MRMMPGTRCPKAAKINTVLLALASWAVTALLAGCPSGPPVIVIEAPEAKLSPSLSGVASVFMTINNTGGTDDLLMDARAEVAGAVTELHDIQDGKMVKIASVPVPAGSRVVLRPARHHIMILNLPKEAKEGFAFQLALSFKKSGQKILPLTLQNYPSRRTVLQDSSQ